MPKLDIFQNRNPHCRALHGAFYILTTFFIIRWNKFLILLYLLHPACLFKLMSNRLKYFIKPGISCITNR